MLGDSENSTLVLKSMISVCCKKRLTSVTYTNLTRVCIPESEACCVGK